MQAITSGLRRGITPRSVVLGQAIYFLITGLWPLVHLRSFLWVTGPKVDLWLVKTVGAEVMVIGAALGVAGLRRKVTPETAILSVGSAAGLAAIDVIYVARRRISPIYLLDALAEIGFIALLGLTWRRAGPQA